MFERVRRGLVVDLAQTIAGATSQLYIDEQLVGTDGR
jgi:hypothetical protein